VGVLQNLSERDWLRGRGATGRRKSQNLNNKMTAGRAKKSSKKSKNLEFALYSR
jgi:hypothetical protein